MEVYKQPLYYEVAFGFVNPKEQVDNFEKLIKKFSEVEVNRFLDIACGPSLQLREIARRGYEAVGLDSSSQMLKYLEKKAKEEGLKIETIQADMTDFRLEKKVDFAFIMMGSLDVESNEKFKSFRFCRGFFEQRRSLSYSEQTPRLDESWRRKLDYGKKWDNSRNNFRNSFQRHTQSDLYRKSDT